jgi:hypothetical protein
LRARKEWGSLKSLADESSQFDFLEKWLKVTSILWISSKVLRILSSPHIVPEIPKLLGRTMKPKALDAMVRIRSSGESEAPPQTAGAI